MIFLSRIRLSVALSLVCGTVHAYEPTPQVLGQHLRKIAVRTFANHTNRPGIEQKLTMDVHSALVRDGRWEIVDEPEADGVLIGDITRYLLMPLKHDAHNLAIEYKLRVLVDISFYDMARKQTLWTEKNLDESLTASPMSSGLPGSISEVEAQEKLWDQLAKDIATRTFEGFGTVTGTSDKAVPNSSPGSKVPAAPHPETFNEK